LSKYTDSKVLSGGNGVGVEAGKFFILKKEKGEVHKESLKLPNLLLIKFLGWRFP
jgi:hypothetical protein